MASNYKFAGWSNEKLLIEHQFKTAAHPYGLYLGPEYTLEELEDEIRHRMLGVP